MTEPQRISGTPVEESTTPIVYVQCGCRTWPTLIGCFGGKCKLCGEQVQAKEG